MRSKLIMLAVLTAALVIFGIFFKSKLDPYRVFNKAGIKFKYASSMGFVLDDSNPNMNVWVMKGNNAEIKIQELKTVMDEKYYIKTLKDIFIQMKAKIDVKGTQLKGKNEILDGKVFYIKMGDIIISQDVYVLQREKDTLVILLQDALDDDGNKTSEYNDMIKIFAESLVIQKT